MSILLNALSQAEKRRTRENSRGTPHVPETHALPATPPPSLPPAIDEVPWPEISPFQEPLAYQEPELDVIPWPSAEPPVREPTPPRQPPPPPAREEPSPASPALELSPLDWEEKPAPELSPMLMREEPPARQETTLALEPAPLPPRREPPPAIPEMPPPPAPARPDTLRRKDGSALSPEELDELFSGLRRRTPGPSWKKLGALLAIVAVVSVGAGLLARHGETLLTDRGEMAVQAVPPPPPAAPPAPIAPMAAAPVAETAPALPSPPPEEPVIKAAPITPPSELEEELLGEVVEVAVTDEQVRITRHTPRPKGEASVESAYQAYQKGNLTRSESLYTAVLRESPENRDALLGLAAIASRQSRADEALRLYARVLARHPEETAAQAGMASLAARLDPLSAESRLKLLMQKEPRSGPLYFALGNLYARQQRWQEAQQAYFKALDATPGDGNIAFNLAVSLEQMNQVQPAITYYRKALQMTREGVRFNPEQVRQHVADLELQAQNGEEQQP